MKFATHSLRPQHSPDLFWEFLITVCAGLALPLLPSPHYINFYVAARRGVQAGLTRRDPVQSAGEVGRWVLGPDDGELDLGHL